MNKNAISGTIILSLSSIIFMISGYIISLWLGKQLGPEDYGIYGVIISLMTTVNIIQTSGLPQSTTKFIASEKNKSDHILSASLLLQIISSLFITILFFIFASPLANLLNDYSLTNYIRATSLILPFYAIFAVYTAYYNGLQNFRMQGRLYIIYSISKLILIITLVYKFHLYGAIIGFIISPIIALLFGIYIPKVTDVKKELYKSLILFSLPLIGYAILSTLQSSIDLFFVKSLTSNNQMAGLYTASQNIARIPYYILNSFAVILFPIITKSIHTENLIETSKKIKDSLRYLFLLLIPGTILIMITSKDLLHLLYSFSYTPASVSLSLLVIGLSFITILNTLTYIMVGADKPISAMTLSGLGVFITSLVCWLYIPKYGLTGAALGTTIGGAITMILGFYILQRQFPKMIPWLSLFKIFAASTIMYIVNLFIHLPPILLPIVYIILIAIYGTILFILKEVTYSDIQIIQSLLPQKNKRIKNYE